MRCSYRKCQRDAKYSQWWDDGKGLVCATHDREIGVANLADGFKITRVAAIAMNLEMDKDWRAEVRAARDGVGVA